MIIRKEISLKHCGIIAVLFMRLQVLIKLHGHRCLSYQNYIPLTWLNLSQGSFSEWLPSGNWLRLSFDLIFPCCFNSYLQKLSTSSRSHFTQRRSVQAVFMKELHLNPFRLGLKATANLHSNRGVDSKWFAQNSNGLSSNGFSTKFIFM